MCVCVQVVRALGRAWHPEHFVCCHCQQNIGSRNFFERDGLPYCEHDYQQLFSPRCFYCSGAILDVSVQLRQHCPLVAAALSHLWLCVCVRVQKVVTALERTWHPEHFFCAQCGSFFGPEGKAPPTPDTLSSHWSSLLKMESIPPPPHLFISNNIESTSSPPAPSRLAFLL